MRSDLLSFGSSNLQIPKASSRAVFDCQSGVWWVMPARIWARWACTVHHACSDKGRDKPVASSKPGALEFESCRPIDQCHGSLNLLLHARRGRSSWGLIPTALALAFETGLATISSAGGRPLSVVKILKRTLPTSSSSGYAPYNEVGAVEARKPASVTLVHAFGMSASVAPGRTPERREE